MSDNTILFSKYIFNFFCRNTAVERFLHIIDQKRHHRNRLYPMIGSYADLTLISMQKNAAALIISCGSSFILLYSRKFFLHK